MGSDRWSGWTPPAWRRPPDATPEPDRIDEEGEDHDPSSGEVDELIRSLREVNPGGRPDEATGGFDAEHTPPGLADARSVGADLEEPGGPTAPGSPQDHPTDGTRPDAQGDEIAPDVADAAPTVLEHHPYAPPAPSEPHPLTVEAPHESPGITEASQTSPTGEHPDVDESVTEPYHTAEGDLEGDPRDEDEVGPSILESRVVASAAHVDQGWSSGADETDLEPPTDRSYPDETPPQSAAQQADEQVEHRPTRPWQDPAPHRVPDVYPQPGSDPTRGRTADPVVHAESDLEPVPASAAVATPATPRTVADEPAEDRAAQVVCIANQKGGVGKTTTSVSLAAALAQAGAQVLLVDLDPQGNATTGLGLRAQEGAPSAYRVLIEGMEVEDATEPTSVRGLHCLPSSLDLAGAEIELVPVFSRELRLKRALDEVRDLYDVVVIDCPPSLGLLTINALAAADKIIVPIQCEYYALEGLGQLMRTLDLVKHGLNGDLELGGVVMTMFDGRTKLSQQVVDEVRGHFGDQLFETIVPRTVRLSEAPGFGEPITVFDPSSRGARAYHHLAQEVAGRLGVQLRSDEATGGSALDRLLEAFGETPDAPEPESISTDEAEEEALADSPADTSADPPFVDPPGDSSGLVSSDERQDPLREAAWAAAEPVHHPGASMDEERDEVIDLEELDDRAAVPETPATPPSTSPWATEGEHR